MSVLVCKHTWQPCCLVDGFSMDWAFTAYTFTLHIWGLILNHFSSTPWVLQALLECLLYSNSKLKPYVNVSIFIYSDIRQFLIVYILFCRS